MTAPVEIMWPTAAPGKARPKAFFNRHTGHVGVYTPDATRRAEDSLETFAVRAMGERPLIEGPVRLSFDAVYVMPKSWSKKKRQAMMGALKTTKPDLDNVEKLIKDSLNGIVWVDDAQVATVSKGKWWGERNIVRIIIEPAELLTCDLAMPVAAPAEQGALL